MKWGWGEKCHKVWGGPNARKHRVRGSESNSATSLVAQWLRLRAPNARVPVRSLVMELDPTCMPQLRSLPATTKTQHNQMNKLNK